MHIAVAAEAMALAARAGIPLETMYDVVTHAAGNS
ncbi:NAD-binding protein (plasmid) [Klebsiella pneumoniae subsp. pneumoniae]